MKNVSHILKKLDRLLNKSFSKIPSAKKVGVLFSGGIDSSQIAWYAKRNDLEPVLFTFGTQYSKDLAYAQKLAGELKLPLVYLNLTKEKISQVIPEVKKFLAKAGIEPNLMQISLAIGFYLIGQKAREKNIELFLSGQGSDELFGGYNKYLKLLDNQEELIKQMANDTDNLFKVDVIRDKTMTEESGIAIYFPYLDKEFIDYVQTLPLSLKINSDSRKWLIRELGKYNGLPEYIFSRPKNALQYSSGIQKIAEKILKATYK